MRKLGFLLFPGALILAILTAEAVVPAAGALDPLEQWGQWRGPLATGVAPRADPPLHWSETENVRFKVPLPGRGLSTPIIWGDRIFLTTAVPRGEAHPVKGGEAAGAHDNLPPLHTLDFMVLALDRTTGETVWERTVRRQQPHESSHHTAGWASASAVTDGRRLYAFFGSWGLYALDLEGKLLWETDLGDMRVLHGHGEGSSPALHGNTLVVNWDHEGESFLTALDAATGRAHWKVARDEVTSWATPLVVESGESTQVVVSATGKVRGYDLRDGKVLWECAGLSRNVVATPVAGAGWVYAASSYDHQAMLAIRLDAARGEITGTEAVAWSRQRDTPYVPSPVLLNGELCFLKHLHGVLTCVDGATGKTLLGPQRLPGVQSVFASPVAAGGRLYILGRNGVTAVLGSAPDHALLAMNTLDDVFSASPAVAGGDLFLRGEKHLYAIARSPEERLENP